MDELRKYSIVLLAAVASSVAFISCEEDEDPGGPDKNVVELAQSNDGLSTLQRALVKFPDLVTTLSGSSEVTVFAPTNTAFENLLNAVGQSSLENIPDEVLRDILEYHVVSGATLSNELTTGDIATVGGEEIMVNTTGTVSLNGSALVTTPDVRATNGIVHIIDEVLIPPSIQPIVGTIVAAAYFNRNFTTLIAAVKAASPAILETLLASESKTLFAPTNEAFTAAGITTLPGQETLDAVLAYHLVNGEVMSTDIAIGSSAAETLNGSIFLSKSEGGVFLNGISKVTTADIKGTNGVVHVIDRTLVPPSGTIAEIAVETPEGFTELVAALARTQGQGDNDLLAAASDPTGNLTVFAPTDAAFRALYAALGVDNINEIPLPTLIDVLKHHIVSGRVFSTDLMGGEVTTLNGNVNIDVSANPPTVTGGSGGSNVSSLQTSMLNIHATNGVIHVIDKVLLPE